MRRQGEALLHPELAAVIAGLGHGQHLVVADPGGRLRDILAVASDPAVPVAVASDDEFKELSAGAAAVVRTGECTPYHNAVLVAGVSF